MNEEDVEFWVDGGGACGNLCGDGGPSDFMRVGGVL